MNIPYQQFEVSQRPRTGIFFLVFYGSFIAFALICMALSRSASRYGWIYFPIAPPLLTLLVINRLHARCTVTVNSSGMDVEVKRSSLGIPLGNNFWKWSDLFEYQYFNVRGTTLILKMNDVSFTLAGNMSSELYDFLNEHFPEKEKQQRGWWKTKV